MTAWIHTAALAMSMWMSQSTDLPSCPVDLCGKWSGKWESCTSGHTGPLHARFRKLDDCHYHVAFHGRFWKVFPFRYTVTLNVTGQEGDRIFLSGERRLLFFGTFQYTAEATACDFHASYCAKKDQGTFTLTRKK